MDRITSKQQYIQGKDKLSILIVDNCQVASMFLKKLLFQLGFTRVEKASSYQEAIKKCAKRNYSLLFIDYHLDQRLNGSELYDLLREKGFISPSTRVITISGDHSTQTVLSTLSKGNGDYLCKPISKSNLHNKISNAYQEYNIFKRLYSLLDERRYDELLTLSIQLISEKNIHELDLFLINFLMTHDKEKLSSLCEQPQFKNRKNYILAQLKLEDERNTTSKNEILKRAIALSKKQPLFTQALDFLSDIQCNHKNYEEALNASLQVLSLTPSIPHRALQTLNLALICNNKPVFLKASHSLANHLPIADSNWCSYAAECFNYFNSYIHNSISETDKNQLILEQKNIARRIEYRLTDRQKVQLNILYNYSLCKKYIQDGDIVTAKLNTLKVTAPFYDNLHELNTVILIELLYLLLFFGDIWLIEKVEYVLKTKKYFNVYCSELLVLLKQDPQLKQSISRLSTTINNANTLKETDPKEALTSYETERNNYPYSSELCIGLLESYVALSLDNPSLLGTAINLVKDMPLSHDLMQRRDNVLSFLHANPNFISEFDSNNLAHVIYPNQSHSVLDKRYQLSLSV
ncbi:response regulator [Aliivibrio salmonicida]|uniref:Response regulator n=1 Tax=Aliivibrio salmonicida (strain LFI1238) TaxID=316275 RepID=B6EQU1_ALISL|nr:response regulator [Aliivibrio salmonicida]AZL86484.1 response regulator [Aliivibrio salmonicida]CAQ81069.1 putative response regulator [Aliivibrio salmonicida LFI1238]